MRWSALYAIAFSGLIGGAASAADPVLVESADVRWAADGDGGTPEFVRHVVPLFSKLGCNMRNCHGSFQGQNGFRLSLFGFEPELDQQELLEVDELSEEDGPRASLEHPHQSLVLRKPTSEDEHGGGQRMTEGGWEYNVFRDWIAAGAQFEPETDSKLVRFELQPAELIFADPSEPGAVRAFAWFDDGTFEDVTALTAFSSNDDAIAEIAPDGSVQAGRTGDTAVIAQYVGGCRQYADSGPGDRRRLALPTLSELQPD